LLPANSPGERCPQCLLKLGLEEMDSGGAPDQAGARTEPDLVLEKPGTMIGRYRLLQEIGRGGFGIVFMAEETEPVQRKVALKIIKAGMDTHEILARFEAERQALALMDHPNIAKILYAGTIGAPDSHLSSPDSPLSNLHSALPLGRPYFVMELVNGPPITDYCDQGNLSTRARLELFIKVCRAVQHAHQKGVIHRDLKPTNVLVTLHDGEPVPKVIDFGVAKALGQKLTDKTLFTRFEQMIGTPAYMSPEQAALRGLDIDTRSDVYSLGVLLYELLTGATPLDTDVLRQSAWDEIRRMIRETDPPKPSTRLSQALVAADVRRRKTSEGAQQAVSADPRRRLQEHKQRINLVRGDLDWITMKALEKDRQRRYETVNGLARDIERHLRNEPVVAGPPSRLYRFQKFVRRNRGTVAAGALVSGALLLGIVVSTWEALRALRAKQEAQTEAAKSQQVSKFLEDTLGGVAPWVAQGRDTTLLREILDRAADRVTLELRDQPLVAAELQEKIGDAYNGILDFAEAERLDRQTLDTRRKLLGHDHANVARSLLRLARVVRNGDLAQAEALDREAAAIYRKLHHPELGDALRDLALVLVYENKFSEADAPNQEALSVFRKAPGDHRLEIAMTLVRLGSIRRGQGKLAETEKLMLDQLPIIRQLGTSQDLFFILGEVGGVLLEDGKLPQAEEAHKEALAIARRIYRDTHLSYFASALRGLATVLEREGKFDDAETLLQEALSVLRNAPGDHGLDIAETLRPLASLRRDQGRKAEAENIIEAQVTILRGVGGTPRDLLDALWQLGYLLQQETKLSQAEAVFREALMRARRNDQGTDHPYLARALYNLSALLVQEAKLDEGEALQQETLEVLQKTPGDQRLEIAKARFQLARIRNAQGRKNEAEKLIRELLPTFRELARPEELLWPLNELGDVLMDEDKLAQAEEPFGEALTLARHLDQGTNHRNLFLALNNQSRVLVAEGKLDQAEPTQREALEILRKTPGDQRSEIAKGLRQLGYICRQQGRSAEAQKLILEGLPVVRELGTSGDLADLLGELGWIYMQEGQTQKAEQAFEENLTIERITWGANHHHLLNPLLALGHCLFAEGRALESEAFVREAVGIEAKLSEELRAQVGMSGWTGSSLERTGKFAEAEVWYRLALLDETKCPKMAPSQYAQAVINPVTIHFPQKKLHELEASYPEWLQQARARIPADDPALGDILAQVIAAPLAEEKFDEAEKLAREYVAIYEKKVPTDWRTYEARTTLGCCLVRLKRYAEAEPLLLSGYEGLREHATEIPGGWKGRASGDLQCLVQLYEATGRPDLGSEWRKKCQEFDRTTQTPQAPRASDSASSQP
jgi:serine/threonine protein kinase/tetratricopeptide (TPR) repeat protein